MRQPPTGEDGHPSLEPTPEPRPSPAPEGPSATAPPDGRDAELLDELARRHPVVRDLLQRVSESAQISARVAESTERLYGVLAEATPALLSLRDWLRESADLSWRRDVQRYVAALDSILGEDLEEQRPHPHPEDGAR